MTILSVHQNRRLLLVFDRAIRLRSLRPLVEAAGPDFKEMAHQLHGMLVPMFVDEAVLHSRFCAKCLQPLLACRTAPRRA